MIERKIKSVVLDLLGTFRGVYLYGARQVGKTTLAKQIAQQLGWQYVSFDNTDVREFAINFTNKFFDKYPLPLVIDEVQKVPEIIPYLKMQLDQDSRPGQVLITGSADFRKMRGIKESLVGRVIGVKMRGLACSEISGRKENLIDRLFQQDLPLVTVKTDLDAAMEMLIKGSFPELATKKLNIKQLQVWFQDYVEKRILSDIEEIAAIRGKEKIINFLYKLAWQSGGLLKKSSLAQMVEVSRPTAEKFFEVLESLFLTELLLPYFSNVHKQLSKVPKVYITDTGLLSFLLTVSPQTLLTDRTMRGKVFETWVYKELQKEISFSDNLYKLFFYRDERKNEIDFIIQNDRGQLIAIEVKAKSQVRDEDLKPLKLLASKLGLSRLYVFYLGDMLLPRRAGEHTVWLVPLGYVCGEA